MYEFQKQDSLQTLEEGLEEFYSINPYWNAFKELLEIDSPNTKVFKQHDYTHVLIWHGSVIKVSQLTSMEKCSEETTGLFIIAGHLCDMGYEI